MVVALTGKAVDGGWVARLVVVVVLFGTKRPEEAV
jgi:hypothetical protein